MLARGNVCRLTQEISDSWGKFWLVLLFGSSGEQKPLETSPWGFRNLTMGLGSSTFPQNMINYFLNNTSLPGTIEGSDYRTVINIHPKPGGNVILPSGLCADIGSQTPVQTHKTVQKNIYLCKLGMSCQNAML